MHRMSMPVHQAGKTPVLDGNPFREFPAWVAIFGAFLEMHHQGEIVQGAIICP